MPEARRLRLPSPALALAFIAVVLALAGTSYAVVKPSKNSVGTRALRNNAVTTPKIRNNAVSAAKIVSGAVDATKVRDESLTGADISEASLGVVPAAASAQGLTQVVYRVTTVTVGPAPAEGTSAESAPTAAQCPLGHRVIGGGVQLEDNMSQIDGFPSSGGTGWTARAANDDVTAPHTFTVYAICVAAATIG